MILKFLKNQIKDTVRYEFSTPGTVIGVCRGLIKKNYLMREIFKTTT
jgi:hypothetical protein